MKFWNNITLKMLFINYRTFFHLFQAFVLNYLKRVGVVSLVWQANEQKELLKGNPATVNITYFFKAIMQA